MVKKSFFLIVLILNCFRLVAQDGTVGDPFTTLGQALTVPSAGTYFFDLGGTTFDTHVDADGYVLVAIDFGNGTGNLPTGTSLDLTARGILNASTLSSIVSHTEVRISASSGNVDATTTNSTLLGRISSNNSLHSGLADNAINDTWTGTGATNLTNNAASNSTTSNNLRTKIFHPRGNSSAFHWQPRIDQQREVFTSGEIGSGESFRLWVRENSSPLPIQLLNFNAQQQLNQVQLTWQTASEINNDYFTLESSIDAQNWKEISTVPGAGNSTTQLSYSFYDQNPHSGTSYYRLKQTDFNGAFSYSPIKAIDIEPKTSLLIYPNPAVHQLTINTSEETIDFEEVQVYDIEGKNVTGWVQKVSKKESILILDVTNLPSGLYYIVTKNTANIVAKQ